MAQREEHHPLEAAFAALLANGLDGAGEALRILFNEASRIERAHFLNVQPHERTPERTDDANGFKPETVMTRFGEQPFDIPQVRGGGFYPSALEKGSRTERALNLALAEMYVQGVSTRKVCDVLVKRLGPEVSISSTQVSRAAETLDETPYLFLDPATSGCAKAVNGSIAPCGWPSASPRTGAAADWAYRWPCPRLRPMGVPSSTA
jgi:hypothetical protein